MKPIAPAAILLLTATAAHAQDNQTITDTFLGEIGTALAVLFLVAVAVEILIEALRGALSGIFRGFDKPFFTKHTDFKAALKSVEDMLPAEKTDEKLMIARLEAAHQRALTITKTKGDEIKALVDDATAKEGSIAEMKAAIQEKLSRQLAQIDDIERKRIVALKVMAAIVGVALCLPAGINAFAELDFDGASGRLGIILTGLAAAGGSSFWHDQIDRVRLLRSASQVAGLARAT